MKKIILPLNYSASIFLCFLSVFVAIPSFAELEWKSTTRKIEVHPLQASEIVPFKFTNTGEHPITIVDLKPSCGCITSTVEKKTYAPGESGEVMVTFNLQGRAGAQLKGLTVVTDDASEKRTKLLINTAISKTYAPSVKRIVWAAGEEHTAKSIRLTNASKTPFPLENVVPAQEGGSVELKTIREGFEYELVITPSPSLSKALIPLIIHPVKPEGLDAVRTFKVYALVK